MLDKIVVRGARANNLNNIDVEMPRDKLVVMTGLSGSGKSSLAFDTIFADGQRRYMESLSSYARQFLGQMEKPDVDEILDYLRSKNIKTAVATATDPERTKQYLTQIGIYDKFDQLVSATTVENGKPEPDVYLYACEQIGEKPKDCIAVEDSPNGILSAYRAGLSVVMVPDLAEPDEETAKLLYAKFDTLAGLKTII